MLSIYLPTIFVQVFEGEKEAWHWSQSGNEHTVQILVILPQREFQQENVCRVQELCLGRCFQWLQV